MTTLQEKIAVMQAFAVGKAIEYIPREVNAFSVWQPTATPQWDWYRVEYRVAKTKHVVYASLSLAQIRAWRLGKPTQPWNVHKLLD